MTAIEAVTGTSIQMIHFMGRRPGEQAGGEGGNLQGGQVVGPDGHQGPVPTQVLVQLVLQVDEAGVPRRVESDAAQYCCHQEGPYKNRLRLHRNAL